MSRLKAWMVLFLLGGGLLIPAQHGTASEQMPPSDVGHYRDSLLHHISLTGAVEMNCYLSYPVGSSVLDPSFGNNPVELSALRRFLTLSLGDSLLLVRQVSLAGYCSPEGTSELNDRLSRDRVFRFYNYLLSNVPIFRSYRSNVYSRGADWGGLRSLIANSGYSWSADALRVIDSDEPVERKKLSLATLDGGRAHSLIYNLYPFLRRVEVEVTYDVQAMRNQGTLPALADSAIGPSFTALEEHAYFDTLIYVIEKPVAYVQRGCPGTLLAPAASVVDPWFALKTNLLFDAALAPNVELEVPLGKRFSVLAEYTFPWWLSEGDQWCYELLQAGLEGRFWLGNRERLRNGTARNLLTGWFVGAYAGGGYYDFQLNPDFGYQGEFYIAAGVSGGYACRLSRRLNLEFSLGVGGLSTKYRKYEVERGREVTELIRQSRGKFFWLGPTKAKVSLVWLLGNKKGGWK